MRRLVPTLLAGAALLLPAEAPAAPDVTAQSVAAAQAFAKQRAGRVSFSVATPDGQLRGLNRTRAHPSASVVKAMLLVAVLRQAGAVTAG